MKKFFLSIFYIFVLTIITAVFYLTFFGYETNRFNNKITEIVKKNNENIDLDFEKVKISLDIKKISIFMNLTKPRLNYFDTPIPLDSLKADIDLLPILNNKNGIRKIIISTKYINFKSVKPIIVRLRPGNFKTILLNNVKTSKFKINSELEFNDKSEIIEGSSFSGDVKQTVIDFKKKYSLRDIKFSFIYSKNLLILNNINAKLEDLELYETKIEYSNNNIHELKGTINAKINSSGADTKKIFSLAGFDIENFSFSSFKGITSGSFNLKLDKTLQVKKSKFTGKATISELKGNFDKEVTSKFLKKNLKNIHIKDTNVDVLHDDKKNNINIQSTAKITDKFFKINFSSENKLNSFNIIFDGESPIRIPLMNYSFSSKKTLLNGKYNFDKKKGFLFHKINYENGENLFQVTKLFLDNDFNLVSFQKVGVITEFDDILNNNFVISTNKNNNQIKIKGNIFDAKFLSKELSKNSKNNFLKKISKKIEIDFDKILTNTEFPLKKFRLIGNIRKGKFEKISGKSEFENDKYLDISLKKEKNSNLRVLEVHSDIAKPIINNYKFFDGLNKGNLIYESKYDDKNSISVLKIKDFKLIKAPAFAKLLTLADFKGLTDALKGEGISFDTLVIKYSTDPKTMKIEEIFMIGPSISILIEGYVEKQSGLISLRGTLVPAKTLNTLLSKIPIVGNILIGKKDGEGLFGVSFKIKGFPNDLKTTVNPVKTLTPRFITRALEQIKKNQSK